MASGARRLYSSSHIVFDGEILRLVREEVQVHRRAVGRRVERVVLDVAADVGRRVDQPLKRHRIEVDAVAAARCNRQRRRVTPAVGHDEAGFDVGLRVVDVTLIENVAVPVADHDVPRCEGSRAVEQHGEVCVDRGNALRHVDVIGIEIDLIAVPFDRFAVGADAQFRNVAERAVCGVFARYPFRIIDGERSRLHWNRHVGVRDPDRCFARIEHDRFRIALRRQRRNRSGRLRARRRGRRDHNRESRSGSEE